MSYRRASELAEIIRAARGAAPVDLLLRQARVPNLFTGEILETAVAVHGGVVVGFGDYEARETLDLEGRHLVPGFMDGHMHLESSMVTPAEYARAVVPRGTTTVFADPHEVANVRGLAGLEYILGANELVPLDIYVMVPSCVPATALETSGARLGAEEISRFLARDHVLGLGEMMNFPGVVGADPAVLAKIEAAQGRTVDGHAPGLQGKDLYAYAAAGIRSDHECTTPAEGLARLRLGMYLMLREGSVTRDLEALAPVVTEANMRRCLLVTDDREPEDLVEEGHMDFLVRKALRLGLDPLWALSMASLNTAEYFGLRQVGAVAPGYAADLVVLDDLREVKVDRVFKNGRLVAQGGRPLWDPVAVDPAGVAGTVHLPALGPDAFRVAAEGERVHVIELISGQIVTRHLVEAAAVRDGEAVSDPERDLLKLAVVERHRASGQVGLGFVRGFGLKRGALASTVAHDSHNLIVVGCTDEDMHHAVKELERLQGGLVAVAGGQVLAELPMPVAGLMSDRPLLEVKEVVASLHRAARDLGAVPSRPFMSLSFLALPVIPALKLTDRGLVDVDRFAPIPLFAS